MLFISTTIVIHMNLYGCMLSSTDVEDGAPRGTHTLGCGLCHGVFEPKVGDVGAVLRGAGGARRWPSAKVPKPTALLVVAGNPGAPGSL